MSFTPGTTLGPYEIVGLLGAGGMGEVYRARDSRFGRDVAVKVLPKTSATESGLLRRFEKEARATGQLNHPNILAVFDVGSQTGTPYLVFELLEGETLRERLLRERLPMRKGIDFALQIARGLAAAHQRGIVHRDLKPENIFISKDGLIKILDFGLAKLSGETGAAREGVTLSTVTQPGTVLGTSGYMSPEQGRGLPADVRSDVFSFGITFYEMLSHQHPFPGATAADVLSAILTANPRALTQLDPSIPSALERIVAHCLEKNPEERFQSMRDFIFDLEGITAWSATTRAAAPPTSRWHLQRWAVGAVLLVVLVVTIYSLNRITSRTPSGRPAVSFERITDAAGVEESPAISPDGKSVAFVAAASGSPQLWIRLLAGGPALQITGDAVPHLNPRWAPDSASLTYYVPSAQAHAEGTIWEVPALGGAPRRMTNAISAADVSHDGKRLAFFRLHEGRAELVVTDRNGGNIKVVAALDPAYNYSYVRWSPNDQSIAYQATQVFTTDVFAVSVNGGAPRPVTDDRMPLAGFAWEPDGKRIVFSSSRQNTLLYLPTFNLWSIGLRGGLRQLSFGEISYMQPDVDAKGRIAATRVHAAFDIWRFPIDGSPAENVRRALQVTHQTAHVQTPSVSPDEREMVYLSDSGGHSNLWVMKLDGSNEVRQITFVQDRVVSVGVPIWSPNGKRITFYSREPARNGDQWVVDPDGSNLRRLAVDVGWAAWSPDSQAVYVANLSGAAPSISKVSLDEKPVMTIRTDQAERPAPSSDGHTLYYVRAVSRWGGGQDLEIRAATPEDGPSRVLARLPASRVPSWIIMQPVLSRDGRWLALLLRDDYAINLYLLPTLGGALRRITDFGDRQIMIARRVTWSADSRSIYAAVGRGDADVVLLTNLVQ